MAQRQILFRLEGDTLAKLDRKIGQKGYKTRNAWFKDVVKEWTGGRR